MLNSNRGQQVAALQVGELVVVSDTFSRICFGRPNHSVGRVEHTTPTQLIIRFWRDSGDGYSYTNRYSRRATTHRTAGTECGCEWPHGSTLEFAR